MKINKLIIVYTNFNMAEKLAPTGSVFIYQMYFSSTNFLNFKFSGIAAAALYASAVKISLCFSFGSASLITFTSSVNIWLCSETFCCKSKCHINMNRCEPQQACLFGQSRFLLPNISDQTGLSIHWKSHKRT